MNRYRHFTALAFACWLLTACSSLGLAQPQNLSERIAYGYGVHTAVLATAATEVTAGTLSSADGEQVLKLADESRALLDSAKALSGSDEAGANSKLVLATAILTQLQAYLRSKQP